MVVVVAVAPVAAEVGIADVVAVVQQVDNAAAETAVVERAEEHNVARVLGAGADTARAGAGGFRNSQNAPLAVVVVVAAVVANSQQLREAVVNSRADDAEEEEVAVPWEGVAVLLQVAGRKEAANRLAAAVARKGYPILLLRPYCCRPTRP